MNFGSQLFCLLLVASSAALHAQTSPTPKDTTQPDTFWFSSSEYVVTESETNLVITVEWMSGDRGYTGWVDYVATNGTATAGGDYTAVSGRLYFNSPASQSFTIPIHADAVFEGEETIQLFIANPDAIIPNNNAVVKIQDSTPQPSIGIKRGTNNTFVLSWSAQPTDFKLETAGGVNGPWTEMPQPQTAVDGGAQVAVNSSASQGFFRLRKANP